MNTDTRYQAVDDTLPAQLPPIDRETARRAVGRLFRKFGGVAHGSADMLRPARNTYGRGCRDGVRSCWISAEPTAGSNHIKGWGRLIHDVSHDIHGQRCPRLGPHGSGHAALEHEIAAYVVAQGWLDSAPLVLPRAKPTTDEKRSAELMRTLSSLARWQSKAKRAATAIRKLERKKKRLTKM